jgi:hydrogenase nickel incorporation protein HypA/HybF
MHEVGIAQEVVALVSRRAAGARVQRVVVEVGKLAAVLPDALRFAFDLCCEGTPLEGARLEIVEVPGQASCRSCGAGVVLERPFGRCGCGSTDLSWISGEELIVKAMEIV